MTVYELQAHRTSCYDVKAERRIRYRTNRLGRQKQERWIEAYLAEFPDGIVCVYEVTIRFKRERFRLVRTITSAITVWAYSVRS